MASGSNASGFAERYLSMSGSTLFQAGARPVSQPPVPVGQSFADDGNNVCLSTVEVECLLTYCENLMSALFKLTHDPRACASAPIKPGRTGWQAQALTLVPRFRSS